MPKNNPYFVNFLNIQYAYALITSVIIYCML